MEYVELMTKLGEGFGIEGLEPDDDGHFNLSVDGTIVSFGEQAERGLLDIVARICDFPAEDADSVLKVLMTAMAPGSAAEDYSFFVVDDDDGLYLRRIERLADLDVKGVCQALEKFANALDEWRAAIGDFQSVLPVVNEELNRREEETRSFGLGDQGFLQV